MTAFAALGLAEPLVRALRDERYSQPTPIQSQAIPHLLAGKDLLGCAQTGTGKTAAFALPILQSLFAKPHRREPRSTRALVLVPTRELAAQVAQSFETYGRHLKPAVALVYGGVGQNPQVRALSRGVDVLVATPGRLLDLMQQGHARVDHAEVLVLDEADHMLDLGFLPDVRRILRALPKKRQNLFFSATMPPEIAKLAGEILVKPVEVRVAPAATTVDTVTQSVHFVDRAAKPSLLRKLLSVPEVERALVFTRTKRGADRVAKKLAQDGIPAHALHGNKSQSQREKTLGAFRAGKARVIVATDIAARGIDVDGITHVVNYELPHVPEVYVHRIGRTARAGASGVALTLCGGEERDLLRDIEKLIRRKLPVAEGRHVVSESERQTERELDAPRHRDRSRPRFERPARGHGRREFSRNDAHGRSHGGRRGPSPTPRDPHHTHRPAASSSHAPVHRPAARSHGTPSSNGDQQAFGTGL